VKPVQFVAFRYLTVEEYWNIYKPRGTQERGSGQLYIDFPTRVVARRDWSDFFSQVARARQDTLTYGPRWRCPVHSIGHVSDGVVQLALQQRARSRFCIANQNTNFGHAERVPAWAARNGFPAPDPSLTRAQIGVPDGLCVFLARTYDNEVWAGWFDRNSAARLCKSKRAGDILAELLDDLNGPGDSGFIRTLPGSLLLREDATGQVFTTTAPDVERELGMQDWFDEDDAIESVQDPATRERFTKIRERNRRAVRHLKELYEYKCQITGPQYAFEMASGKRYVEAHHLVPLGQSGADDAHNIIVVSAHIHRMLHYATVSPINLKAIKTDATGWGRLTIAIDGEAHQIRWHPRHLQVVKRAQPR
jgi:5-methylcytosine-specific restriction enzyme A